MSSQCNECTDQQRINKHQLSLPILSFTFGSADMINELVLPRKYTTTHNDVPPKLFVAVGHDYDACLLSNPDVVENSTEVVGKWVKKDDRYEIHLNVLVSDEFHPNAKARNAEFCKFMSVVLETIGFVETLLVRDHPELGRTRIFIHFKSDDPDYDRVESWGRLAYWVYQPKVLENKKPEQKKPEHKKLEQKKPEHKKLEQKKPQRKTAECKACQRR